MIVAVVSAVLSVVVVGSWFQTLEDSLSVTGKALDAADQTIEVVDDALIVLSETLVSVDGVFSQTEATLGDVSAVVLSTGTLLNDEIPNQIGAIQAAMDGLIDTANVVDGILSTLSFVGVDYNPAVPLDDALVGVNDQLGELSSTFAGDAAQLFSLAVSINRLTDEVGEVAASIVDLDAQIDDSQVLVAAYKSTAREARDLISVASDRLSGQVWLVRILAILLFGALAIGFSLVWWTGRSYRIQA
jgi:hypothetical protein